MVTQFVLQQSGDTLQRHGAMRRNQQGRRTRLTSTEKALLERRAAQQRRQRNKKLREAEALERLEDALDRKEAEALERKGDFGAEDKLKFLEEPSLESEAELEALLPTGLRGKKQRTKATKKLVDDIKKQLDKGNITKANKLQQELVDLTRTSFDSLKDELSSFRDSTVQAFSPSSASRSSLPVTPIPTTFKQRKLTPGKTFTSSLGRPRGTSTPFKFTSRKKQGQKPSPLQLEKGSITQPDFSDEFPLIPEKLVKKLELDKLPRQRGKGLREQLKAAMDDADKGDPKKGLRRIHKIREQIKDPTHRVEKYIGRVASDMNVNI